MSIQFITHNATQEHDQNVLSIQLTSKDIRCYMKPAGMTNEAYLNTLTTRSVFTDEDCMRMNNRQDLSENKVPSTCIVPVEALRLFLEKFGDIYIKNGQFNKYIGNAFNTCDDETLQTLFSFDSITNLKQKLNIENKKFEIIEVNNMLRQFYMLDEDEMLNPCIEIDLMTMQTSLNQQNIVSFKIPFKLMFKSLFQYILKRFDQEKNKNFTFIVPHAANKHHIDFLRKIFDQCSKSKINFVNHTISAFAYAANHQLNNDQRLKDGNYLVVNVEDSPEITQVKYSMNSVNLVETYFIDKTQTLESQVKKAFDQTKAQVICVGRVKPAFTQALLEEKIEIITVQNQSKALVAGGVYFDMDATCIVTQKLLGQKRNVFDDDDGIFQQQPFNQNPQRQQPQRQEPFYKPFQFTYYDPQIEATKKVDNEDALNRQLPEVQKKFKVSTPEFDVWHFTFMSIKDAQVQGIYHFALDLEDYPHKAPHFKFLSQNGVCPVRVNLLYSEINEIQEWQAYTPIVDIVQTIQNLILNPKTRPQVSCLLNSTDEQLLQCAEQSKKFCCEKCFVDHAEIVRKLEDEKKKKETSTKKVIVKTKVKLDLDDD